MKKSVWVCLLSLALLLGIGLTALRFSNHAGRELESMCQSVLDAAQQGDWRGCADAAQRMDERWQRLEGLLQLWTVHEDTDEVSVLLSRLLAAARQQDNIWLSMTGEELLHACRHLYHRDAPGIRNIF